MSAAIRCEPGEPYCVGMESALNADVRNGLRARTLINAKTMKSRTIVTHRAMVDGKKLDLKLDYCPWCKGDLSKEA